jgi:hypothetical protein
LNSKHRRAKIAYPVVCLYQDIQKASKNGTKRSASKQQEKKSIDSLPWHLRGVTVVPFLWLPQHLYLRMTSWKWSWLCHHTSTRYLQSLAVVATGVFDKIITVNKPESKESCDLLRIVRRLSASSGGSGHCRILYWCRQGLSKL